MAVTAGSVGALAAAAFCAALAAGVRSQVVWLTVPLLVLAVLKRPPGQRRRAAFTAIAAYVAGGLLWGIPLIVLSGGPAAYLGALASQGSEDFTGVAMLLTAPSPRQLARALYYALLAPWAAWPLGVAVVAAAACGLVIVARRERAVLVWLVAAFGPYFAFDLMFQEMVTTRYALPLIVPTAFLAVRGCRGIAAAGRDEPRRRRRRRPACCWPSRPSRPTRAPPRRRSVCWPTCARRATARWRRPLVPCWPCIVVRSSTCAGRRCGQAGCQPLSEHLPAPPKHEWLELVKYWNRGGRAPIWFVADPPRSDLALVDRHAMSRRGTYRWPFAQTDLIGGVRPNVMDWHLIQPPGWYLGEGWSLTPETAGVARDEGRGPGRAPIQGWLRRRSGPVTLMIGGRNLAAGRAAGPDCRHARRTARSTR